MHGRKWKMYNSKTGVDEANLGIRKEIDSAMLMIPDLKMFLGVRMFESLQFYVEYYIAIVFKGF